MTKGKINYEYMAPAKEAIPLLKFKIFGVKKPLNKSKNILIINSCIIGDFIASVPAIRQFIKEKKKKVDLIVSPSVKNLAEKIKGVRKVYVARSIQVRNIEKVGDRNFPDFDEYDTIIIIRTSKESYSIAKNIRAKKVKTPLMHFTKFTLSMIKNNLTRKTPIQLREIIFEILNVKKVNLGFEQIFNFEKKDYSNIKKLKVFNTNKKIIIIHTGASWIMNKWDNKNWIELLNKINRLNKFRFIFVGTTKEVKDYREILKNLDFKAYSLINKLSLEELILVLRRSNYFIGIDSGPRNMAHLANLKSLVLLGPGPHTFMSPNKKDIIIDKSNGKGIYQRFFYKKIGFIHKITVNEVFEAFKKLSETKHASCNIKK